jgi:hypothetical protein
VTLVGFVLALMAWVEAEATDRRAFDEEREES